jgi:hypothetical protein
MPGAVFVQRKEHAIQHVVAAARSSESPEMRHEQLVESGLQHELECNEGFAPVPCNQEGVYSPPFAIPVTVPASRGCMKKAYKDEPRSGNNP